MKNYILPVRDLVVHPNLAVPVFIDNPQSVACLERATIDNQKITFDKKSTAHVESVIEF